MSSAKKFPRAVPGPSSRSRSPRSSPSSDGATTTPYASSTPSSTHKSSVKAADFGDSPPNQHLRSAAALAVHVNAVDFLDRIGRICERIAGATEHAAVQSLLSEGTKALGAQNAVFVSFVREKVEVSSCRFMLACDPAWCRQYLEAGLIAHDPWLAYASQHSEPIVASSLVIVEPERRRAIELATCNGFASTVLVPVHSGAGHSRISLLCLGSPMAGYFEGAGFGRFKLGARALACELHDWWLARLRREMLAKMRITSSELELLRRQSQGQTSKRIAAEMHVSRESINSRFQRMRAKLGVSSRKTAARLAAEIGLILP